MGLTVKRFFREDRLAAYYTLEPQEREEIQANLGARVEVEWEVTSHVGTPRTAEGEIIGVLSQLKGDCLVLREEGGVERVLPFGYLRTRRACPERSRGGAEREMEVIHSIVRDGETIYRRPFELPVSAE